MQKEISLRVSPRVAAIESERLQAAAKAMGVKVSSIQALRTVHHSIDARQRNVMVNLTLRAYIDEPAPALEYEPVEYPDVSARPQAIVVGAGPAGLFAALRLIELGVRPIVLERGKDVHARKKDIALISRQDTIDPDSNYAFGEGGAGAFSDGKLYTRSTKRGDVNKILRVFCQHGASTDILSAAHPHIGTDRLPRVIENMRKTIIRCGGEVHFQSRVAGLLFNNKVDCNPVGAGDIPARKETSTDICVCGVRTVDEREYLGPVILATGHSARDVYHFLYNDGVFLEPKGLAIGLRLEHPAHLIDQIFYHSRDGRGPYLPAAEYRLSCQQGGRGVYSFCMCPGGFVIPAASGPNQLVVNGMSPAARNSRWSNSGIVVELRPEDLADASLSSLLNNYLNSLASPRSSVGADLIHARADNANHPLRMMFLQEALERECFLRANKTQHAPAQRMTDFISGRLSDSLPSTSYQAGTTISPLHEWLPPFLRSRLRAALLLFGERYRGFLTREATLLAIETRTSAPVRITRDRQTLEAFLAQSSPERSNSSSHITPSSSQLAHSSKIQVSSPSATSSYLPVASLSPSLLAGLYPCGEGAGYAGGIVSAAIDGERCAQALVEQFYL